MKFYLAAFVIALVCPTLASAEHCQQPEFADAANYAIAVAKQKTNFHDDNGKILSSYILPGDEVVVVSQQSTMACVDFATPNGDTTGWLPLADVTLAKNSLVKANDWSGKFQRDVLGSYIAVKPLPGKAVSGKGEAYWAASLELAKKSGPNIGEIADQGRLENGIVHIGSPEKDGTDCSIDLRLLSKRYLIVAKHTADDGSLTCWGHNVTFDGLYVKVTK